jgi:hypothetical protein
MSEATQPGADLQSAANAISSLMDNRERKQPNETEPAKAVKTDSPPDVSEEVKQEHENEVENTTEETKEEDDTGSNYELPSSIDILAQDMGVDPNKLFSLKVKTKIDGQEGETTLADLVKSYQLEGHLTKKSMALAEQNKAWEAEKAKYQEAINNQFQQLHGYSQFLENELFHDYKNVNWQELRDYNPAEFAAKQLEYQNRQNQIHGFNQQVNQRFQQHAAEQNYQRQVQEENFKQFFNDVVGQEHKSLIEKIPEFGNPEKANAAKSKLQGYLTSQGFNNDDLNSVYDHRYYVLAHKAMLYDNLMQSKPEKLNQAKSLPKFIKQSGVKSKSEVRAEGRAENLKQLRKSGSVKAAAAAIADLI